MTLAYLTLYFMVSKKKENQSSFFAANPDVETSAALWNMLDDFWVAHVNELFYRKIEVA